jgi:hypothetical protein
MDIDDDDLSMIGAFQLNALDRMQTESSKYVWRIVERVSFLPIGGQQWERQVQLRLPSLPPIQAHKHLLGESHFIVSLGTFRRRRFADFTVTTDGGSQCRLLTRRQHGYSLASCLLFQFLHSEEWGALDQSALRNLHSYLVGMMTTVPSNEKYTVQGAQKLLDKLFRASDITNSDRKKAARKILSTHCESIAKQTQYLCWVTAKPGDTVRLSASYTQADSPSPRYEREPESEGMTSSRARLWWRNWRTREYAKYNMFPFRYSFDTPSYSDCQSYYFTITPPLDTRITLLDWGNGSRVRTAVEDTGWDKKKHDGQEEPSPPDGIAEELDCASFGYHFHNHRTTKRRRSDEQPGSDRRRRQSDRRRHSSAETTRLHAFMRPDPIDNGKLVAIGFLSLSLTVMAERGTILPGGGSSISQWLLLTPAALVLFVSQQRRHHYARFTRRYRLSVWIYIILAMLFAGSVAFGAPAIPLLSAGENAAAPRVISATFALASGILIVASIWSGRYFERTTRKRYRHIVRRVRIFGTPSLREVTFKYRWRPGYHMKPTKPVKISPDPRGKHPSDKVYTSTARHGIDRALGLTGSVVLFVALTMIFHWFHWHWGVGEECAITKAHDQRVAAEKGKPLGEGRCENGHWTQTAYASHKSSKDSLLSGRPAVVVAIANKSVNPSHHRG